MPPARTIFHNTAREDGGVDDFDEGTWRYFTFNEQSLVALRRRLQEGRWQADARSGSYRPPTAFALTRLDAYLEF
ncbi:hypothetical protein ACP70R_039659 [Stipagrostis hirtigluma subsp. patula]